MWGLITGATTMRLLLMMFVLTATASAELNCDPLTQYAKNGECCKMCPPGTSMSNIGSCQEPQCQECKENEYQDKYTFESKCQLQPYCDKNSGFEKPVHQSKKERTTCKCENGFHCSSQTCIICVAHTTCKPGEGVRFEGNHTDDRVCWKCPNGWFSNSENSTCQKLTECADGYTVKVKGTDTSDTVCEIQLRQHLALIVVCLLIALTITVAFVVYLCKGDARRKVKGCVEACRADKQELPGEANTLMVTQEETEKELTIPEQPSTQEEGASRTPEENEDELSTELSAGVIITDNGNYVVQENGKADILSRQESQTQTYTD
ncbi:tumor necrosis factor receptor superfamily member 5 isoform X1 [Lates calcarifer]|nr:tumor necrosis factor receptor superfamily member 5 isoform X1 [Lates calcarifer]